MGGKEREKYATHTEVREIGGDSERERGRDTEAPMPWQLCSAQRKKVWEWVLSIYLI